MNTCTHSLDLIETSNKFLCFVCLICEKAFPMDAKKYCNCDTPKWSYNIKTGYVHCSECNNYISS